MPNQLTNIRIDEVSLCSKPANATVDERGRVDHAVIAFFKAEEKDMDIETILKSQTATRDEIYQVVAKRAGEIAERERITPLAAETRLFTEVPGLYEKYRSAPAGVPRAPEPQQRLTKSEAELDARIAARAERERTTIAKATANELDTVTGANLYARIAAERQQGDYTMQVPGSCPTCARMTYPGDQYCANCGARLRAT